MSEEANESNVYFQGSFGNKIIGKELKSIFCFYSKEDADRIGLFKEKNNEFYEYVKNNKINNFYLCGDKAFIDFEKCDFYYSFGVKKENKDYILKNKKIVIFVFNQKEELLIILEQEVTIL